MAEITNEKNDINYLEEKYAELLECYMWENEKRHRAEREKDYWHKVFCVTLATLVSFIVSMIFRCFT